MMRAADMAPELGTTSQYLPQVLRPMVQAGWIDSEPGPTGGYRVAAGFEDHSLLDLVELIEGSTDTRSCVFKAGLCEEQNHCAMHIPWVEVRTALVERLAQIPLSDSLRGQGI